MKTSLLAFSIICFAFTTELLVGITTAAPEPVLDIKGQKVRTGVKYYILPVIRGKGGGLTVSSSGNNNNNPCFYVVQEKLEINSGQPVTFIPYNAKSGVILTSTDLNIKSSLKKTTTCAKTPVWKLLKVLTGVWFLSTGGVEGNPGVETVGNWYKIEKADKDYVLSFCPSFCKCLCRELGIYIDDDGNKHLALSDKIPSFRVMFKRAKVLRKSTLEMNKTSKN